jgi:hypothetical protein
MIVFCNFVGQVINRIIIKMKPRKEKKANKISIDFLIFFIGTEANYKPALKRSLGADLHVLSSVSPHIEQNVLTKVYKR